MLTFEEWMDEKTPDGKTHQDEVRHLFLALERNITAFKDQIDRRHLFLQIAQAVYEHSEMNTHYKTNVARNGSAGFHRHA